MSLPSTAAPFLDLGVHTSARNQPSASAEFGAEAGGYFLKSSNTDAPKYKEYALEPDPRAPTSAPSVPSVPSAQAATATKATPRKKKRQQKPAVANGASIAETTTPPPLPEPPSFPSRMISAVGGVAQDVASGQPVSDALFVDNRWVYIALLAALLIIVWNIFH